VGTVSDAIRDSGDLITVILDAAWVHFDATRGESAENADESYERLVRHVRSVLAQNGAVLGVPPLPATGALTEVEDAITAETREYLGRLRTSLLAVLGSASRALVQLQHGEVPSADVLNRLSTSMRTADLSWHKANALDRLSRVRGRH
jgi:hypothetical protein